jgi:hypothetical protein
MTRLGQGEKPFRGFSRLKIVPEFLIIKAERHMGANRQYKDSVFSLLFNDPEALKIKGEVHGL